MVSWIVALPLRRSAGLAQLIPSLCIISVLFYRFPSFSLHFMSYLLSSESKCVIQVSEDKLDDGESLSGRRTEEF